MFNTADGAVPFKMHEEHRVVAFVFAIHIHPEGTVEGLLGRVFRVFLFSGREED